MLPLGYPLCTHWRIILLNRAIVQEIHTALEASLGDGWILELLMGMFPGSHELPHEEGHGWVRASHSMYVLLIFLSMWWPLSFFILITLLLF